jgi:hypothetical protein
VVKFLGLLPAVRAAPRALTAGFVAARSAPFGPEAYTPGVGIREVSRHGHPFVRAGVVIAAAILVALLIMMVVSVLVGLLWTLVKIVLFVLLVAGVVHIWTRSRAAGR